MDDYSLEVESHFAHRRGTPFIFSAKDWAVLQQWQESGVPLPVVLEAIDQCFEKREKAGRHRTVSSLRYCRHAVKELWEERKQLLVGSGAELPEVDPVKRLQEIAALILAGAESSIPALRSLLQSAADQVRALDGKRSVPRIEEGLLKIEQDLMEQLTLALPPPEREQLEGEMLKELGGYVNADSAVLEKTRQANLRRLLRKRLSLPRLSLFG